VVLGGLKRRVSSVGKESRMAIQLFSGSKITLGNLVLLTFCVAALNVQCLGAEGKVEGASPPPAGEVSDARSTGGGAQAVKGESVSAKGNRAARGGKKSTTRTGSGEGKEHNETASPGNAEAKEVSRSRWSFTKIAKVVLLLALLIALAWWLWRSGCLPSEKQRAREAKAAAIPLQRILDELLNQQKRAMSYLTAASRPDASGSGASMRSISIQEGAGTKQHNEIEELKQDNARRQRENQELQQENSRRQQKLDEWAELHKTHRAESDRIQSSLEDQRATNETVGKELADLQQQYETLQTMFARFFDEPVYEQLKSVLEDCQSSSLFHLCLLLKAERDELEDLEDADGRRSIRSLFNRLDEAVYREFGHDANRLSAVREGMCGMVNQLFLRELYTCEWPDYGARYDSREHDSETEGGNTITAVKSALLRSGSGGEIVSKARVMTGE
jgi:hypothetical protein